MSWHEVIIREMDKYKKTDLLGVLAQWLDTIRYVISDDSQYIVYIDDGDAKYYMIIPRGSVKVREYGRVIAFTLSVGDEVLHIGIEIIRWNMKFSIDIHVECYESGICKIEYDNELADVSNSTNVEKDKLESVIKQISHN